MSSEMDGDRRFRSTTLVAVRRGGKAAMAGDGQVSLGQTVMKAGARLRRFTLDGARRAVG